MAAISVAQSAGDLDIHTLYLASRRFDGRNPGNVTPCGSCCQLIHDLAIYSSVPLTVVSLNEHNGAVCVIKPGELLPHAFNSQKLRRAAEQRRNGFTLNAMTDDATTPRPTDDEFSGGPDDHLTNLPDVTIPGDQFDELLMNVNTPDDAPALAEAFTRPRRFTRDDEESVNPRRAMLDQMARDGAEAGHDDTTNGFIDTRGPSEVQPSRPHGTSGNEESVL